MGGFGARLVISGRKKRLLLFVVASEDEKQETFIVPLKIIKRRL